MSKKREGKKVRHELINIRAEDADIKDKRAHCVTPPKLLSTMKAEILSFISPVFGSFMGVLANTVKISERPPLLTEERGHQIRKKLPTSTP